MPSWDYLIVTASHASQAQACEEQLKLRQDLGMLDALSHVLVVPDPRGRRIGSGGSTLWCLREVLRHEQATDLEQTRTRLRILIDHAGGDSRRLAAIPKGSGLGTSSIMGAVILAMIQRALGHVLSQRQLFHRVLCLEQLLTTNDEVEALMERVRPYAHDAKLLGAGGGGFLLIICTSSQEAARLKQELERRPANDRARFFDYAVNPTGLTVTVC